MKKKLLLTIFIALFAGKVLAQGGYTIKAGGNYSSFRGQGSELDLGFAFGIGREWQISKRTGLALELMYTEKKAILRNKTVGRSFAREFGDAFDIFCDIRYLEIPFMWKYYRPFRKTVLIELYVGPSLELAIKDRSQKEHLYDIFAPQGDFLYDYYYPEDLHPLWYGSSGFNVNGGIAIGWSAYTVELRYSRAFHDVDVIAHTAMNEHLDFLQLLIGLKIERLVDRRHRDSME